MSVPHILWWNAAAMYLYIYYIRWGIWASGCVEPTARREVRQPRPATRGYSVVGRFCDTPIFGIGVRLGGRALQLGTRSAVFDLSARAVSLIFVLRMPKAVLEKVTPEVAAQHGLTPDEFSRIKKILALEP